MKTSVVFLVVDKEGLHSYKCLTYDIEEIYIRPSNKKGGFVKITEEDMVMEVVDNDPDNLSDELKKLSGWREDKDEAK